MINEKEIIEKAITLKSLKFAGVYFLVRNKKIIYVGQGVNVLHRIRQHKKNIRLAFDSYYYIREESLNGLCRVKAERIYIKKFKPLFNFSDNPDYLSGKKEMLRIYLLEFNSYADLSEKTGINTTSIRNILMGIRGESHIHYNALRSFLFTKLSEKRKKYLIKKGVKID